MFFSRRGQQRARAERPNPIDMVAIEQALRPPPDFLRRGGAEYSGERRGPPPRPSPATIAVGELRQGFGLAARIREELDRRLTAAEQELEQMKDRADKIVARVQREEADLFDQIERFNSHTTSIVVGLDQAFANVDPEQPNEEQPQPQDGEAQQQGQGQHDDNVLTPAQS